MSFRLYKGFDSVDEAIKTLHDEYGFYSHEIFNFIEVSNDDISYIYPVMIATLDLQVIITKEVVWYRNRYRDIGYPRNSKFFNGAIIPVNSIELNELEIVEEMSDAIEPTISRLWDESFKNKLERKYKVRCAYKGSKCNHSYLYENSVTLLSTLFYGEIS